MNIVLFEDQGVAAMHPVTTGRAAYAITCASFRLVDWLDILQGKGMVSVVRPHLQSVQICDFPQFQNQLDLSQPYSLLLNARLVPAWSNVQRLLGFRDRCLTEHVEPLNRGKWVVAKQGWQVTAAMVRTERLAGWGSPDQWIRRIDQFDTIDPGQVIKELAELRVFEYPHQIIQENMQCLSENLEYRIASGRYEQYEHGVYMGQGVKFGHHVVFDASNGPILVDDHASLGPFSMLRGPVYLGPHARLSEYASIKDFVTIAHHSKIGGEVESTVVEAYSNKQHHGFLGHSYLGSWINLGAGTCNSDLKNTYGIVSVEYGQRKVSTGMQFLGCLIGDYSKTAINTSLFTGKVIGNASMVYGFATRNVPSFVNYARTFNEVGLLPPEVIVATQARMFARRNVEQRPCDIQLIYDMFRLTAAERPEGLSDMPLSL